MELRYKLIVENPEHHYVAVVINGEKKTDRERLSFFMPSWTPGSYLMREYARHVQRFHADTSHGEVLWFFQPQKGVWTLDWGRSRLNKKSDAFQVSYRVYCHDFGVRNSHVDSTHAFIHGPSVFMGVLEEEAKDILLKVEFPPCWSKISTGLQDVSTKRSEFIYSAPDYDTLLDSPLEIGCQETDGFVLEGVEHELSFTGKLLPHQNNLKSDIKTICATIAKTMGEIPCSKYTFLSNFAPEKFGGLEHSNSSALHFCPRKMANREGYVRWLSLVAHEYFHTWNGKRIRPRGLGPFDYQKEATTGMLWLVEGLTSFMDDLFVYRSGLCTLEEYLEVLRKKLDRYWKTPGRMFSSLEESSFNAWIKLYRPDENTSNSSISYYLKGGIVFWALNVLLYEQGKTIDELLLLLWNRYKQRPETGLTEDEVYQMLEKLGGKKVSESFVNMVRTTEELDLEKIFHSVGLQFEWEQFDKDKAHLGADFICEGDRLLIKSVMLDGPAHKSGFNAGDEIIALDGIRVLDRHEFQDGEGLLAGREYMVTVSRLQQLREIVLIPGHCPKSLKKIVVVDRLKCEKVLLPGEERV